MRHKYVSVIFAFMREKKFGKAMGICRENGYTLLDYAFLIKEMISYAKNKVSKAM